MTPVGAALEAVEARLRAVVGDVRRDEPLARHVQFRIGGPADLFVVPRTLAELEAACGVLAAAGVRPVVLGQGSNVLVGDRGIRGVVVKVGKGCDRVAIDGTAVIAEAGAGLPALALQTARRGLAGLEFGAGIPGSVGGAVVMNAGAHGHAMDEVTEWVEVLTPSGLRRLAREALGFAYRTSLLQEEPWVVARAGLRLRVEPAAQVQARLEAWLAQRGVTQPLGPPSSGCVFRNPPGDHAGRLIDAVGGKGLAVGGARVSELHANYILNTGTATAAEVLALADLVRARVRERAGIALEMEVKLLGEF
ncbi:MAG: UDP-N-acetylmuramate dehydrogenase [Armatimonadota bacterium]|nr:UDP-N-acetylmuramate dehydrogenase [Armatimonadota bacterium]